MGSLDLQELRHFDGTCVLRVGGEIDESSVDMFELGLVVGLAGSSRMVVDLTSCTVSSDGLAALVGLNRMRDRVGVTLVARDECVLRMLDAVGVLARLGTYRTVADALSPEGEKERIVCPLF
jgi:anti-anti-sigma factor